MGMVYLNGQMEEYMLAGGPKANNTVKVFTQTQRASDVKACGKTAKENIGLQSEK